MSLPQPAQSGREQQPMVTAISLEKRVGAVPGTQGAASSSSHTFLTTVSFLCMKSSPLNPSGRVLTWRGSCSDLSGSQQMNILHLLAPRELGTLWGPVGLETI